MSQLSVSPYIFPGRTGFKSLNVGHGVESNFDMHYLSLIVGIIMWIII